MTATPTAGAAGGPPSPTQTHPRPAAHPGPASTGSRATRVIGLLALAAIGLLVLYGLVISPADVEMADSVRLYYVHVPSAICLALGCLITTVASALWLRRRSAGWDALAEAGGEVALVFAAITLLTGSLWGRPTWGTYWTWDARLTSTAVLTAMLVGYLALRRLDLDPDARSVRAAVLGLLLLPNFVVVNRSVEWWRSLHQESTLFKLDPSIEGDMLVALMIGYLTFGLIFTWLMIHRFRVAWLEQAADRVDLDAALATRRAEAQAPPAEPTAATTAPEPTATTTVPEPPASADGAAAPTEVTSR